MTDIDLDRTPFIHIAKRGNRPRFNHKARVPISSFFVHPDTDRQLLVWMFATAQSRGLLLDDLVNYAAKHGFQKDNPKLRNTKPIIK